MNSEFSGFSPPSFDFTRRPISIGPADLLAPGQLPEDCHPHPLPPGLLPLARFARPDRAQAVHAALSRCALEPDNRAPLPAGTVDVFTLPGRYRLQSLKATSPAELLAWLSGGSHDPQAHLEDEIVLSFTSNTAAVLRRANLLTDPSPLIYDESWWPECVEAYPQDGRWLIESTCHRQIRLYLRNPVPEEEAL